jgi:hypothetical protein
MSPPKSAESSRSAAFSAKIEACPRPLFRPPMGSVAPLRSVTGVVTLGWLGLDQWIMVLPLAVFILLTFIGTA